MTAAPTPFQMPPILDEEIAETANLIGLPASAFLAAESETSQQVFLKSASDIDVAACPGSGKTTVLVAKLAILAEKWQEATSGLCVLSHTNAARSEIEGRLSGRAAGQKLLSYPHFVGTIHAFVDQFLAVPWLKSRGYPIRIIDSEICEKKRWDRIPFRARYSLEKSGVSGSDLRIVDTSFAPSRKSKGFPAGSNTDTYKGVRAAFKEVARDGYHCFDDMFIWATELIDRVPAIIGAIRDRFSVVFIDEAQDNSELQSAFLYRLFAEGDNKVVRQRLGDSNQAIFDFVSAEEAKTDRFPDSAIVKNFADSHRFGQTIANFAQPLGVNPSRLNGNRIELSPRPHTIFLFSEETVSVVIEHYAQLLIDTFTRDQLRNGVFTAVGLVHHRKDVSTHEKIPHHIGHYWPPYEPRQTLVSSRPSTFVEYVFWGQSQASLSANLYVAAEAIAEALLRLADLGADSPLHFRNRYRHRQVVQILEKNEGMQQGYLELITRLALDREVLTENEWRDNTREVIHRIAESVCAGPLRSADVDEFLAWKHPSSTGTIEGHRKPERENTYRYPEQDPLVEITVGSIHSVKGETHTATLVCETFWHEHNLSTLKSWLLGRKTGFNKSDGPRKYSRLKAHYVAMTRPSDLLCLAMKKETFETREGSVNQEEVELLKERGWALVWL